jgi:hypothetical protein
MLRSLASVVLRVTESIRSFRKVPVSAGFVHKLRYRALLCDQKGMATGRGRPFTRL